MFLKTPVLESKLITLRTEHHQAQNSGIAAWDKMPDPHTKHLSKIISPTQQRIQQNRSYITGAKQCHAQQWNSLGQRVSTSILPHHLSAYLNFTGGQLPTPQSATFSLGCKKSGSDRKEREDGKMSLCCLLPVFILCSVPVQADETRQNRRIPMICNKRGYKHGHKTRKFMPAITHPPKAVTSWWPAPPGHWGTNMVFGGTFHTALSL